VAENQVTVVRGLSNGSGELTVTDPGFESLIKYRRELRERQADEIKQQFGLVETVRPSVQQKWHITEAAEAPCLAMCGARLVKLAYFGMRQPWRICKSCKRRSRLFVDLWQRS